MNEWRQEVITSGQALSVSQGLEKRVPPPLPYRAKAPPHSGVKAVLLQSYCKSLVLNPMI